MSSLIKFYVNTESKVSKLRMVLYEHGVSSIIKPEVMLTSSSKTKSPTIELYIDSDQKAEALVILKSFDKKLA